MARLTSTEAEKSVVTGRRRAILIGKALLNANVTLEDLKTMRLEDIIKIEGIGPEMLTNLIIIKELMWKEGL